MTWSCHPWWLLLIFNAASNDICSAVFGNLYGYKDPELLRLLDLFSYNFRRSSRQGKLRGPAPALPGELKTMPNPKYIDLPRVDQ